MGRLLEASPLRVFYGMETRYDHVLLPQADDRQREQAAGWVSLRDAYFARDDQAYATLDTYAHVTTSAQKAAANTMGKLLSGSV